MGVSTGWAFSIFRDASRIEGEAALDPEGLECGVASLGLGLRALPTCDLERNRPVAGRKEGRWSKKRVSWAAALTHFPGLEVICLTLGHARLHMQHTARPASPMSSQSLVRLQRREEPTRYRTNSTAGANSVGQGRGSPHGLRSPALAGRHDGWVLPVLQHATRRAGQARRPKR